MSPWDWVYAVFGVAYAALIMFALRSIPYGPRRTLIIRLMCGLLLAFFAVILTKIHLLN